MRIVIKIGGALIAKNLQNVLNDIEKIKKNNERTHELLIVHGGGPQINETMERLHIKPKYFETPSGFKTRFTDQETIDAVIMSLAGLNNKRVVEALQKKGINAVGLTGVDGSIILAERKDKIMVLVNGKRMIKRGEYSGKVIDVNPEILEFLLDKGYIPVIGCIAKSKEGDIVNVDGDRAASNIASVLNADLLISMTDVEGIYKDLDDKKSLISKINKNQLENLIDELKGGMKKKAHAILEALNLGIKKVIICSGLRESPLFDAIEYEKGTVIINE
ncbi:MAG: [LysW]-aminoadipate kinase [Promethearchaeota archaeon]